ncbi:hypothetical protein Tco_0560639 [Tanacetum coccineum]
MKDPGLFTLPCRLWDSKPFDTLVDLRSSHRKVKTLRRLLCYRHGKRPATPLLIGRGFLETVSAVIYFKKAKITVGEGVTSTDGIGAQPPFYDRKDFIDYHLPWEWEIARDAELNPFKDVLVFRKMAEILGAIPINLIGNMWESEELIKKKIDWNKPPKEGDGA